jgi:hypothetical protein
MEGWLDFRDVRLLTTLITGSNKHNVYGYKRQTTHRRAGSNAPIISPKSLSPLTPFIQLRAASGVAP